MKRATAIGLAHSLAAAGTVDEVHAAIQRGLPPVLDAQVASLAIVDRDARELRLRPLGEIAPELSERFQRIPLDSPMPITEVVRTGELLVLRDYDDWRLHAPDALVDEIMATGVETTALVPLVDSSGTVVAALGVGWQGQVEVDAAALATLRTVAELCEQTLERAWTTDTAAQRATDLADLATRLADALTVGDVLEIVTSMAQAPLGAVATSVGLIDHHEGVLRTHHGRGVGEAVKQRYADPPLDARLAFTDAARTAETILIEDFDAYVRRYPESAGSTASLGQGARAAVPISASDGQVIGAMVHAWPSPRVFDDALASTVTTIAEMAGQAIERARLLEKIRRDAARHEALAGLAELLATARTSEEVAAVMALHSAPVAEADSANVAIYEEADDSIVIHHHPGVRPVLQERYARASFTDPLPVVDVMREGGILVFQNLEEVAVRYPHLVDDIRSGGRNAIAAVNLPDTTGRPLGALGLSWNQPLRLDDDGRVALEGVARLCAQALERARLSDAEHRLVTTLQDSVLSPLPQMDGIATASRYLPAARHIGMGGDWYQGVVLDEHRYALIVGDVAGHGITAIGEMAQLRAVIGALVRLEVDVGEVFQQTTALLRTDHRTVTATALLAVVDTETSLLHYVAAGHPPPLLRTPQGATVLLSGGRQPLLGVPMTSEPTVGEHPFPPGSLLVTYTDGLVERRREPIDQSIDRLLGHLHASRAEGVEGIASDLITSSLAGREPDDDVAIVVLCHQG